MIWYNRSVKVHQWPLAKDNVGPELNSSQNLVVMGGISSNKHAPRTAYRNTGGTHVDSDWLEPNTSGTHVDAAVRAAPSAVYFPLPLEYKHVPRTTAGDTRCYVYIFNPYTTQAGTVSPQVSHLIPPCRWDINTCLWKHRTSFPCPMFSRRTQSPPPGTV